MCELIQHDIWIPKPKLFQSAQILSHAKAHEIVVLCLLYIYLIFVDKFMLSVVDVFVAVIFLVVVAIWRDDCVSYIRKLAKFNKLLIFRICIEPLKLTQSDGCLKL